MIPTNLIHLLLLSHSSQPPQFSELRLTLAPFHLLRLPILSQAAFSLRQSLIMCGSIVREFSM